MCVKCIRLIDVFHGMWILGEAAYHLATEQKLSALERLAISLPHTFHPRLDLQNRVVAVDIWPATNAKHKLVRNAVIPGGHELLSVGVAALVGKSRELDAWSYRWDMR
ncbi:hypothetical protein BN1723_000338 [Verticillium longisporum]|uniref:Uncharacterized protein n=1 Tax=Verticillium longisporum TaxID=100787 RepID=A0A0G4LFP7_VERLO|nr:hypothetical protein BN1723_000338 [Verticillium longisporum]